METDRRETENDLYILAEAGMAEQVSDKIWTVAKLNWRDEEGRTALMRAAIRGDWRMATALKEAGADLQLSDKNGRKAVDLAALYGHGKVLVCLIEGGCGG